MLSLHVIHIINNYLLIIYVAIASHTITVYLYVKDQPGKHTHAVHSYTQTLQDALI